MIVFKLFLSLFIYLKHLTESLLREKKMSYLYFLCFWKFFFLRKRYILVELRCVVVTLLSFILSQNEDECPKLNITGCPILIKKEEHPINFTIDLLNFEDIDVSIYYC